MRIDKEVYNYINYELSNYKLYEERIEDIKSGIIESSPNVMYGVPKGNSVGNPTLYKVIEMSTPLAIQRMEHNKACIERALKKLDMYHNEFFDKNYKENNGNNKIGVCYELNISERTYYRMRGKIIEYVAREMGMI